MAEITYPFDPTGKLASNLIHNEQHTTTEANFRDYRFIIPDFAPFHAEGLKVRYKDKDGNVRDLVPGFDYYECMIYLGATRSIGKPVYGGISINKDDINGVISLEYQTLGGEWIANKAFVMERLTEMAYNPRTTVWDIITDKTDQFPPVNHLFEVDKIWGQEKLIEAITGVVTAMLQNNDGLGYVKHFDDKNNPHRTNKDQTGLGKVENYAVATKDDVSAHTSNELYVTPYTLTPIFDLITQVKQSIKDLSDVVQSHKDETTSAHGIAQTVATINQTFAETRASIKAVNDELSRFETQTAEDFVAAKQQLTDKINTAQQQLQEAINQVDTLLKSNTQADYDAMTLTLKSLVE